MSPHLYPKYFTIMARQYLVMMTTTTTVHTAISIHNKIESRSAQHNSKREANLYESEKPIAQNFETCQNKSIAARPARTPAVRPAWQSEGVEATPPLRAVQENHSPNLSMTCFFSGSLSHELAVTPFFQVSLGAARVQLKRAAQENHSLNLATGSLSHELAVWVDRYENNKRSQLDAVMLVLLFWANKHCEAVLNSRV